MNYRGVKFSVKRRGVQGYAYHVESPAWFARRMNLYAQLVNKTREDTIRHAKGFIDRDLGSKGIKSAEKDFKAQAVVRRVNAETWSKSVAKIDTLSMGELRALVKLALTRRVLVPSHEGRRYYMALWKKGYAYVAAAQGGFILNMDNMSELEHAVGLRS